MLCNTTQTNPIIESNYEQLQTIIMELSEAEIEKIGSLNPLIPLLVGAPRSFSF